MAVSISRALRAELLALAAAEPDREVCGLLFGGAARIESIRPCVNVSASPADSFEIDPAALIAAHKAERAGGPNVVGCYHSHPNGLCEPSARDAASAVEGQLWLIVSSGEIGAWRFEGASGFARLALTPLLRQRDRHSGDETP